MPTTRCPSELEIANIMSVAKARFFKHEIAKQLKERTMIGTDPFHGFRFRLDIGGIELAGFSDLAIGDAAIDAIEYRESVIQVRKLIGLRKFTNITLKRGFTNDRTLFEWYDSIADDQTASPRKNVVLVLKNHTNLDKAAFVLQKAWPSKYNAPNFKAKSNEVQIDTLELATEGITECEP